MKERDSMGKKRFAPSVDCTKSVARRGKGAFRPSRLIVPGWRYGSGQMPASSTRHPSEWADTAIYWSAGLCVYIQNICPYLQRLARRPCCSSRATLACKRLQTQMSIPTLNLKFPNFGQADDQQNFHEIVPSISATVEDHNSFV